MQDSQSAHVLACPADKTIPQSHITIPSLPFIWALWVGPGSERQPHHMQVLHIIMGFEKCFDCYGAFFTVMPSIQCEKIFHFKCATKTQRHLHC